MQKNRHRNAPARTRRVISWMAIGLLTGIIMSGTQLSVATATTSQKDPKDRPIEREFPVTSEQKLALDFKIAGPINITGWDQELVSVRLEQPGIDWEKIEIDSADTPSEFHLTFDYVGSPEACSTDLTYNINVPRRFNVEFNSPGGHVSITGVEGEINGKTMAGQLDLTQLKGTVRLKTMGGSVRLTDSNVNGQISTMRGQVLLQNVSGNVNASSMGGNITLTAPAGLPMDVDITLTYTKNSRQDYKIISDFDISQKESTEWDESQGTPRKQITGRGSVAGGQNKIKIQTINGNVYLKRGA